MRIWKLSIFDLDQTVICSKHRYKSLPTGDIDLDHWREWSTRQNIMQDRLLPIAQYAQDCYLYRGHYVAICTARVMSAADFEFLHKHKIHYHYIAYRLNNGDRREDVVFKRDKILHLLALLNIPKSRWRSSVTLFDDNTGILQMANDLGIAPVNSLKFNGSLLREGKPK